MAEDHCGEAMDRPAVEADTEAMPTSIRQVEHAAGITTFASFKVRDYRWFWTGALLSNVGTWMQTAALGWLVFALTRDELALGLVSFAAGIPITVLALGAGAVADRYERRKLLIWLQWPMLAQAAVLGTLTLTEHASMTWIYALSAFGGIFSAFMFPAWQAAIPDLVPRRMLLNAISLNAAQFNTARFIGPLVAGAVVLAVGANDRAGTAAVFYVNAVSYLCVVWALSIIRPKQAVHPAEEGSSFQKLAAGVRYAAATPAVRMLLLTQVFVTVFAMPMTTLLPALARETLGLGQAGYSMLLACNGAGALAGALVMASLKPGVRRERIIAAAVPSMAVLILALAFSRSAWLSGALLFLTGIAFLASNSSVNTSLQTAAPPHLRGRVLSLFVLAFTGIMPFSALAFGALGRALSRTYGPALGTPYALAAGAVVLAVYGLVLALRPKTVAVAD